MKLTDVIHAASSYYRGVLNFFNHPLDIVTQQGRRMVEDKIEEIDLPLGRGKTRDRPPTVPEEPEARSPLPSPNASLPVQSSTAWVSPFARRGTPATQPQQTESLVPERDLRGRWGKYRRVGEELKTEERVRWYAGVLTLNNKPVWIKQYLLPPHLFNAQEIRERKEKFAFVSNLNLRSHGGQDFRCVNVYEAIAPTAQENCCYLVCEVIPQSQTLQDYLHDQQVLDAQPVRQVLNQVLQTLWFLHHQKVRLPTGEIQYGLPHGNLNLKSLLIAPATAGEPLRADCPFFIHVTDLALWEHLFLPDTQRPSAPTAAQDLIDLGYVAWALLTGQALNPPRPNLLLEQAWITRNGQPIRDLALKQFIQKLIAGEFQADAETARQVLLHLPQVEQENEQTSPGFGDTAIAHATQQKFRHLLLLGLLGGCLGSVLWLGWWWLARSHPSTVVDSSPCCLREIPIPATATTYVTQAGGIWNKILRAENLVAFNQSLEQVLKQRDSRLINYRLQPISRDPVAAVQSGQAEFALTEWRDNLPAGLIQEEVAYDGLVVVVAFGDAERSQNIPAALQGKINFEHLRQLYTGNRAGWRIPENLKNWRVQLYQSDDPAAIARFERGVLREPEAIAQFRSTVAQSTKIVTLPTNQMFGEILKDFEQRNTIGIGFTRLSQMVNQCSVYPLAIGEQNQEVQPLAQHQNQPIHSNIDLCGDKGSYGANVNAFNTRTQPIYPLRYRLTVVYRQGSQMGRHYAAALKTDEGQALLNAAGLVPLRVLHNR